MISVDINSNVIGQNLVDNRYGLKICSIDLFHVGIVCSLMSIGM